MTEPGDATTADAEPLAVLRGAVGALPAIPADEADAPDEAFDAAEHAARFEAVHDAMVAVLADVDRT
jgi:AMMECR1 domain-containing protein